jgi:anti-sigma factor RsiW
MSFNPNDNNLHPISRTNYEEYFLLYADEELSPVEKTAVEEFLKEHPDLQHELDLFLQTKLPVENFSLENKEALLAGSMKLNSVDENLLLYIDNELNEAEKKAIEQKLKADKTYRSQYTDLLKTKPATTEAIIYPYKNELYRYEEKRRFPYYWLRIAAAAVIIIAMSVFVFNYQSKQDVVVADGTKKIQPAKEVGTPETKTEVAISNEKPNEVKPPVAKTGETNDAPNVVRHLEKKKQLQVIKKKPVVIQAGENEAPVVAKKEEKEPQENNIAVSKKTEVPTQQTLNNPTVTPPSVASLNNQTTTSLVAAVQNDVVKIDNEKKASLKGILRKATRFIERRTNISTTNEDNELLIGAVALKL